MSSQHCGYWWPGAFTRPLLLTWINLNPLLLTWINLNPLLLTWINLNLRMAQDAYQRKQRKHYSSTSLAFVRGIHQWSGNSLHKGPLTRKMIPSDDVIMRKYTQMIRQTTNRILWDAIIYMHVYLLACYITCSPLTLATFSQCDSQKFMCQINIWNTICFYNT